MATILDPMRTASKGDERRREPRMPVQGSGKLAAPGTPLESAAVVQVQDVSLGGACLLASRDVAIGEQLVLVLQGNDGKAMSLLCSVAHCRQLSPDVYAVGAQFLHGQNTDGAAARRTAQVAAPRPAGEIVAPAPGRERYQRLFHG
jgi:hypothetical protein